MTEEMPSNVEAERVLLGTLINYPGRLAEVRDRLAAEDFYHDAHRFLFETMTFYFDRHGRGADWLTLSSLLEKRHGLDKFDLMELQHLADELFSYDLLQDADLVRAASEERQIMKMGSALIRLGRSTEPIAEKRAKVETMVSDLLLKQTGASEMEHVSAASARIIAAAETAAQNGGRIGVETRFKDLDLILDGGLQKSDLIIVAGRPGSGKTSLAVLLGLNAAEAGVPVAIFTMEMSNDQIVARIMSGMTGIPTGYIRSGKLFEEQWRELVDADTHLADIPLYLDDQPGAPLSALRGKILRLQARIQKKVGLIIVDYLQLMEKEGGKRDENRTQVISELSRGLKHIARTFQVPVIALSQLSRAVESRQDKRPQLSDLRESGSIEQDCDICIMVYRDEMYAPLDEFGQTTSAEPGVAELIVAKHRNGPVGTAKVGWTPGDTRFRNLDEMPQGAKSVLVSAANTPHLFRSVDAVPAELPLYDEED